MRSKITGMDRSNWVKRAAGKHACWSPPVQEFLWQVNWTVSLYYRFIHNFYNRTFYSIFLMLPVEAFSSNILETEICWYISIDKSPNVKTISVFWYIHVKCRFVFIKKQEMFSVGLGNNIKARGFRFLDPLLLFSLKKKMKSSCQNKNNHFVNSGIRTRNATVINFLFCVEGEEGEPGSR